MGCLTGAAFGQTDFAVKLTGVDVEGAQRIEIETIRSYLLIKPGEEITSRKLDESLKKIFATGLFADVSLKQVGARILINVVIFSLSPLIKNAVHFYPIHFPLYLGDNTIRVLLPL